MDIRNGVALKPYKGNEVVIISKSQLNDFYYSGADQIIAAKNITRNDINWKCRKIKFGNDVPNYPIEGEKAICLKNYWNVLSNCNPGYILNNPSMLYDGDPLINGMIGELSNIKFTHDVFKYGDIMEADFSIGDKKKINSTNYLWIINCSQKANRQLTVTIGQNLEEWSNQCYLIMLIVSLVIRAKAQSLIRF